MQRTCAVIGCDRQARGRGLCATHYSRLWKGQPMVGPVHVRERACKVCGAAWCILPGNRDDRKLCGSHACWVLAHTASFELRNGDRNEQILAAVRAGEAYEEIAVRLGTTKSTVSRVARAAGIRKYAYAPRRRR